MTEDKDTDPLLIDVPMPIVTPRLILRPPQAGDGALVHEAKLETWEQLNKWMVWAKEKPALEEDEALCRKAQAQFILREDMMLFGFCRETGRFITGTGLHRFDWKTRVFEIGYWVRRSAQGKGYASESTNALIRYAFGALNANKVKICHDANNDESRRVIEKLGLEKEGVFKNESQLNDGALYDRHWYGRLNAEGLPPLDVSWGERP